jgi:hypothetical protein
MNGIFVRMQCARASTPTRLGVSAITTHTHTHTQMTLITFANCAFLSFGVHAVLYKSRNAFNYNDKRFLVAAVVAFAISHYVKTFLLNTFVPSISMVTMVVRTVLFALGTKAASANSSG